MNQNHFQLIGYWIYVILHNSKFVLVLFKCNHFQEHILFWQVVGPMANNSEQLFGDYSPTTDPKFVKTPLRGLTDLNFSMNYAAGCVDGTQCLNYSQGDVKTALTGADLVVVCLGTGG